MGRAKRCDGGTSRNRANHAALSMTAGLPGTLTTTSLTEPGVRAGAMASIRVGSAIETPVVAAPPIETVEPAAKLRP